ncbi:hypothetical protein AALO_G00186290 [Alosa alosa]|uniref:Uncharacterized protein n=1 Tax=Alosa alosa TaxID=278164 RepID=A0AAV6G4C6_9TELE|nr:hypothetical protein AALO_G00186290 [Alosa alosa]
MNDCHIITVKPFTNSCVSVPPLSLAFSLFRTGVVGFPQAAGHPSGGGVPPSLFSAVYNGCFILNCSAIILHVWCVSSGSLLFPLFWKSCSLW